MAPRTSGTVTKALGILDLFLFREDGLTATQIATATGIHKSSVVRLCATLEGRGYLQRDPRGIFTVGSQIEKLARIFRKQFSLEEAVRPVLARLRDETGESASVYAIEGDARVCLFRENSRHRIRHVVEEGARLPFKEGVVGRVLLAFSGSKGALYRTIRDDGYLDADGREPFTASVSAPVFTKSGHLAGALVVSGLSSRFSPKERKKARDLILETSSQLREILPDQNTSDSNRR
jgi:DNA-binding IclR family transcriptional regulator